MINPTPHRTYGHWFVGLFFAQISRETNIMHTTIALQLPFVGCFLLVFRYLNCPIPHVQKNIKYFNNY